MEFTQVFTYEGPLASVSVQSLQEESHAQPVAVQPGIFSERYWKAIPQEFAAQPGKTYRVVVEVAE